MGLVKLDLANTMVCYCICIHMNLINNTVRKQLEVAQPPNTCIFIVITRIMKIAKLRKKSFLNRVDWSAIPLNWLNTKTDFSDIWLFVKSCHLWDGTWILFCFVWALVVASSFMNMCYCSSLKSNQSHHFFFLEPFIAYIIVYRKPKFSQSIIGWVYNWICISLCSLNYSMQLKQIPLSLLMSMCRG